ncbi:TPA: hypothetical protein QCX47_003810 [Bacillus mycoides]|nr:hypothetical protein [Bacillus mycoides]
MLNLIYGDYKLFTSGRIDKIIRHEMKNVLHDVTHRVLGYEVPIFDYIIAEKVSSFHIP